WHPGELWELLGRWASITDAEDATFIFTTNAGLGPGADELRKLLSRFASREETPDDRVKLAAHALEEREAMLRRVHIQFEVGGASAILVQVERRLHRLLE